MGKHNDHKHQSHRANHQGPDNPHVHSTHPAIIKRLRRAMGHLGTVIEMIESHRPCLELAQQLHAVESAIANAKKTLIHDHIDHCLDASVRAGQNSGGSSRQSLDEFKEITKYL
jgi:DNA-binding FrmR family transcriptional regulator